MIKHFVILHSNIFIILYFSHNNKIKYIIIYILRHEYIIQTLEANLNIETKISTKRNHKHYHSYYFILISYMDS